MGRVLVIGRLRARDLRYRPVQAALPPRLAGGPPADRARLQALARAPGVTGHSGPYPAAAVLRARATRWG